MLIEIFVSGSDDCVNRAPLFAVKAKKKVVKTFSNWIENFNFAPFLSRYSSVGRATHS